MDKLKILLITALSLVLTFFDNISLPLILLIISNIIDIVTGTWKSFYLKQKFTYQKMMIGIIKKCSMYVLIMCASILDTLISYTVENLGFSINGDGLIGILITIWMILNELVSIICNLSLMKVPIPGFLLKLIKSMQEKIDKKAL